MLAVAEPLVAQASEAWLSPASQIVRSASGYRVARTALWAIVPANSKSEMEMDPPRLVLVTKERRIAGGNSVRQRKADVPTNHTPPMPRWQASHAPAANVASGTSSRNRVGRGAM